MSVAREVKPSKARRARRRAIDLRPTLDRVARHRWLKEAAK